MDQGRKRGILLTVGLILLLLVNIGFALFLLILPTLCFGNSCGLERQIVLPLVSVALNIFLIYQLFRWKRWAFYGLIAVAGLNVFFGMVFGMELGPMTGFVGLAVAAVAGLLIIPKRKFFV
ncbi:MAG TPA: hypothetical protein VGA53_04650 [Candidatus Paceibacterota bacterium]